MAGPAAGPTRRSFSSSCAAARHRPADEKDGYDSEAAIGFLRHAEIKHGRVAMAAFVGYIVQANGIHFPWGLTRAGVTFGDISAAGGPADQWDALPTASKLQILGFVALFEFFGENSFCLEASGEKHYMRGGKPGFYPDLKKCQIPHPVPLTLWDPFGFTKKMTPYARHEPNKSDNFPLC